MVSQLPGIVSFFRLDENIFSPIVFIPSGRIISEASFVTNAPL